MGAGHKGRVTDHRDPASPTERHAGRLEIEDGLEERLRGSCHRLGESWGEQTGRFGSHLGRDLRSDPVGRDREFMDGAVDVGEEPRQLLGRVRRPVPDEIETALANYRFLVCTGHWIAQHLLPWGKAERKAIAERGPSRWRQLRLSHEPAPGDIPGVERRGLRQHLTPDRREQPVGSNNAIGLQALPVREPGPDNVVAFFHIPEFGAKMIAVGRKGGPEQAIEAPPARDDLVQVRLRQNCAVGPEKSPARHPNAERGGLVIEARPRQYSEQLGMRDNASTPALERACAALEHVHFTAGAAEQESAEKPRDRAPDHDHAGPDGAARQGHCIAPESTTGAGPFSSTRTPSAPRGSRNKMGRPAAPRIGSPLPRGLRPARSARAMADARSSTA